VGRAKESENAPVRLRRKSNGTTRKVSHVLDLSVRRGGKSAELVCFGSQQGSKKGEAAVNKRRNKKRVRAKVKPTEEESAGPGIVLQQKKLPRSRWGDMKNLELNPIVYIFRQRLSNGETKKSGRNLIARRQRTLRMASCRVKGGV